MQGQGVEGGDSPSLAPVAAGVHVIVTIVLFVLSVWSFVLLSFESLSVPEVSGSIPGRLTLI